MKILMITPFPPDGIGGAETFIRDLIKEASKHHEVDICTMKKRKKAWKGTGAINFFSTFPAMFTKSLIMLLTKKYEILHAQGLISGMVAVLLKKVFKVKVFITLLALYDFNSSLFNRLCGFVFRNCDLIFVEGKNGYLNISPFVNGDKIKVFSHWCDQEVFYPPKERDSLKTNVLFVGRPIPEKGKHIIEESERILNDKEKYEFTYLEDMVYDRLPDYYRRSHIVCVPSLYPEGYSRVVIEAASCGCAVITSDRGSLPEMVKDFGRAIDPSSVNFAYNISDNNLDQWLNSAHEYAKENFSSKNATVFLKEYENANV